MLNRNINEPFIGVVPHRLRKYTNLGEINLNQLISNNGYCGSKKTIKDLNENDHIVIYPSSRIWFLNSNKIKCNVSLVIIEPKVVHGHYYRFVNLFRKKFFRIFTRYPALEKPKKNIETLILCDSWVSVNSNPGSKIKTKYTSLIASNKNKYEGHKLRHQAIQIIKQLNIEEVDILGRGYAPFEKKEEGLQDYMFSIVVENCQESEYFSEKILDCFMCKTIPVYWGATDISNIFDPNGIIAFKDLKDLRDILPKLTQKTYNELIDSVELNYNKATNFRLTEASLIHKIESIISNASHDHS